ncbi:MAG TPA: hypothetical protein VF377_14135 [Acidimicrobiia bacterium]
MAKSLIFGITVSAILIWLTFFAGPGSVHFATLVATGLSLWWFATVDPARLVDDNHRPHLMLFTLAVVGCALLVTAAALLSSASTFLMLALGLAAIIVGFVRAIRFGMQNPPLG